MHSLIRLNTFWVILACMLLNPITTLAAQPTSLPKDPVTWQPLNPSNPEHAVIILWHIALINNDFPNYLRAVGSSPYLSEDLMKLNFKNTRANTPPTLMISVESHHTNPNGSKDYGVAGCIKGYMGDPREIRMVAGVTPIQVNGKWKVSATGFVPPSNNLIRACPVK